MQPIFNSDIKMNKLKLALVAISFVFAGNTVEAGGLLTNTNQNIAFLRNPARDAAIGIDGVYSNPAGVVFLDNGFHLSLNLQNVHQTRTIETGFPLFVNNFNNPGQQVHKFKGNADAPILPSIQAAYNKGDWSFQFGFAVVGGGGKCEYDDGLGSFEQVVAKITTYAPTVNGLYKKLAQAGIPDMSTHAMGDKYGYETFMRGRQYYYGFTVGAARKLTNNLSVYGGLRMLYGTSNYYGYVKNIQVEHIDNNKPSMVSAADHFGELSTKLSYYAGAMEQAGNLEAAKNLSDAAKQMGILSQSTQDIELNCDQTGWGVAPIIGIDYKTDKLNLAAKYEFKTRMRLKNKAANSLSAAGIPMLGKFADGKKVAEDSPALLTVGAQYSVIPSVRVMAGWHHYFDVDTEQWTKDQLSDTNEYLFGAEWDINKMFTVSAGGQRTKYGNKDAGMNDISFNVNSYSYGLGVAVNVTDKITVNAAYFQTLYDDYDMRNETTNTTNSFTRTNRVLGVGVDLKF